MRVLQNCPSLKDQILKYINNLTRAYLKLTVRKNKVSASKLQLNLFKTVSSHLK